MATSSPSRVMPWHTALLMALLSSLQCLSLAKLQVGFYSNSCPNAESIVRSVVRAAASSDPTVPAALLRLHYHDCIVQGCDASILIEKTDAKRPEKQAQSHAGLRGLDVIDRAKAQLETACPGVVSCADIVALAARDSVVLSRGPNYKVPTGRRDGRVSNETDAANMPDVNDTIAALRAKFAQKGLSEKDLVVLSGAHTIGTTACFFIEKRLYNFVPGGGSDPTINPRFLPELQSQCPKGGGTNARLPLDRGSEKVFDMQILSNIQSGFGVIESDANLYNNARTKAIIDSYLDSMNSIVGPSFESDFVRSIVKMGKIGVLTGTEGEIRQVCSAFN
ncbi:peroxidase 43 [Phoenix dactylifera]|uniref:Peroxidase n=1 Tax=Phoenix dactylifera TaxID=42345 RepID=A0A8B7BW29_PHODC|nr:peroxidase 43 [Phoenix dactylifera]